MAQKVPKLPDYQTLQAMGFTMDCDIYAGLYNSMKLTIEKADRQAFVQSILIDGLPNELDMNIINRILYYRGQGAMFYVEEMEKFYFLPFTLNGEGQPSGIDEYGRYTAITPLPFNGKAEVDTSKEKAWIPGMIKIPRYEMFIGEELTKEMLFDSAVILRAYSQSMAQNVMTPQKMHKGIITVEAMMFPYMNTAMMNSTGITGMRVGSMDERSEAEVLSASIQISALTGKKFIPITGPQDFQELSGNSPLSASEFLLAMQAIDNFRIGDFGLDNGGLFQKNAHELQQEAAVNGGCSNLIMQDRLAQYQQFCDIANSIWGLNMIPYINPLVNAEMNLGGVVENSESEEAGVNAE